MLVTLKVLEGWLSKQYQRDAWRMRSWTADDYRQEGLLTFLSTEKRYSHVTEPPHLMALFKTTWYNHIHDRSRRELTYNPPEVDSLDEEDKALRRLEAEPFMCYDDVIERAAQLSRDAFAVMKVLTSPSAALDVSVSSIVLTGRQAQSIALALGWVEYSSKGIPERCDARVRRAMVELLEEFGMPTPIQTLATATGTKATPAEARQTFLIRLVEAVVNLPEESWNKLPRASQDWYNSAAELMNEGKPVPDIEDEIVAEKPISEARRVRDEARAKAKAVGAAGPKVDPTIPLAAILEETKPAVPGKKGAPVLKVVQNTPAPAPAPIDAVVVVSPTQRGREIMTLNPLITPVEVRDQLKAEGFALPAMSAIQAMRSDIRAVLKVLEKHGRLTKE